MSTQILDELESWLDERYRNHVEAFRNGDTKAGIRALETIDIRIKLAATIEAGLQIDLAEAVRTTKFFNDRHDARVAAGIQSLFED